MNNTGMKHTVYRRQLSAVAFLSTVSFKLLMLPQYFAQSAGRDAWFAAAFLMTLEIVVFIMIYHFIKNYSIYTVKMWGWVKKLLMIMILYGVVSRSILFYAETMDYVNIVLFEEGMNTFKLLAVMLVVFYISYKGINAIARTAQVVFLLTVIAFVMAALTFSTELHFDNLTPFMADGPSGAIEAAGKHIVWFGDFTPFIFLTLEDKKKDKDKASIPLLLIFSYIVIVGFFILFTAVYGDAGVLISHVFAEMTVFTRADNMGSFMIPLIVCWLMMSVIRLCLLTFTALSAGEILVKKRFPVAVVLFAVMFTVVTIFGEITKAYDLATSPTRFFSMTIMYGIPLGLLVLVTVQKRLGKKRGGTKHEPQKLETEEEAKT